jgi:hypothetical protein
MVAVKGSATSARSSAWVRLVGGGVALIAGVVVYRTFAPHGIDIVRLQAAGSSSAAVKLVGRRTQDYRDAVLLDLPLIAGYTLGLIAVCGMGAGVFWTDLFKQIARAAAWSVGVAAVANLIQDVLLLVVLADLAKADNALLLVVKGFSFVKFATLLIGILVAIASASVVFWRLVKDGPTREKWRQVSEPPGSDAVDSPVVVIPPPPPEATSLSEVGRYLEGVARTPSHEGAASRPDRSEYWARNSVIPPGRERGGFGVCVSGGGIRSAAVTLGAPQSLRERDMLEKASYLVSVSGGGYTAGAFQLALHPYTSVGAPSDVLARGSVEEDHIRRHSSYLADGFRQWVVALAVILRGFLASIILIGLTVLSVGFAVGLFYRSTKIADLTSLAPSFLKAAKQAPSFPDPSVAIVAMCAGFALAAGIAYGVELSARSATRLGRSAERVGRGLIWIATLLAVVGIGVPAVVWTSAWLSFHIGWARSTQGVGATGTAVLVLSYLGTVVGALRRRAKPLLGAIGSKDGIVSKIRSGRLLPYSMLQMVLMWVCLVLLCAGFLIAAGWAAASGADRRWWSVVPIALLLLAAYLLDQTWLSLHPFYRQRLASAFAVRRQLSGGEVVADPYDWTTRTMLHTFAARVPGFPKVIFATAANLTGQDRTPPGRRAVSYTMADDYIGGPQVGWLRTDIAQKLVSTHLAKDLTVEAAVAISGAAFASAMGGQTRFYEVFLALTNARLGAWLPNPYYVWLKAGNAGDWRLAGLPYLRRLSYQFREIFGLHPATSRLVFCTDGGHYDNLGLVELLRHRPHVAICFDATGDGPPLAGTLAQAITLSKEELGVEIKLRQPLQLVAGGGVALEPASPLESLSKRLSHGIVCVADVIYPACSFGTETFSEEKGCLVIAKANLTGDTPYELLSYAVDDPMFPHDPTVNQWFDCAQFDAYQGLGALLGSQAAVAAKECAPGLF